MTRASARPLDIQNEIDAAAGGLERRDFVGKSREVFFSGIVRIDQSQPVLLSAQRHAQHDVLDDDPPRTVVRFVHHS